jgi:hypothetical protein
MWKIIKLLKSNEQKGISPKRKKMKILLFNKGCDALYLNKLWEKKIKNKN